MKRIIAVLIAFTLVFSLFAQGVQEVAPVQKEEEKTQDIIVYAKVPAEWKYATIWAWENESGKNAFDGVSWPGVPMIPDPANEGWFYIWVPGYVDIVIINGQMDGSDIQTDGITINGSSWITVNGDKSASVVSSKLTQGELPEKEGRHWVYATVDESWENPCVWAWNVESGKNAFQTWPGMAMRPMGNGKYSAMVPDFCDGLIINGNGGTVQTVDIKDLDPADIWVTVDKDGKEEVSYADPEKKVENITIYAKVPEDWNEPCLWAWSDPDGAGAYTTWPGAQFDKGDDGWYQISVGGWINSIIVNANGGTIQTGDQHKGNVEKGRDLWIVVTSPEVSEVYYEKPVL